MRSRKTLRDLLAAASRLAGHREARGAWAKRASRLCRTASFGGMPVEGRATAAQWRAAQQAMDERLDEAVDRLFSAPGFPGQGDQNGRGAEEEFERLFDEEVDPRSSVRGTEREVQKVEAFRKPLRDAAERDLWPRELYFGGI